MNFTPPPQRAASDVEQDVAGLQPHFEHELELQLAYSLPVAADVLAMPQ